MSFQLNEKIQDILIGLLRLGFTGNEDYPYITDISGNTDKDNTQIAVYRKFPKTLASYPTIAVAPPRIPSLPRTLGNNFISATMGDIGGMQGLCNEIRGGMAEMNFTIEITGESETERDRIADYCVEFLNNSQRSYLEDKGIEVLDVAKDGDTIKPHGSDYLWVTQVSCNLFAEYSDIAWYNGTILTDVAICQVSIYSDLDGLTNI